MMFALGNTSDSQIQPLHPSAGVDLTAEIDTVIGHSDVSLRGYKVKFSERGDKLTALDARGTLDGGKPFAVLLKPDGPRTLYAESTDAGQAFKLIGFYPNLQGQIGGAGSTLIAGHYDYHVIGPAVFFDLAKLKPGDVVEYWDGNIKYTYVVDWLTAVPYSQALNSYIESAGDDTLLLVTCYGEFDREQFGGYDRRTLVHTTRLR